MIFLADTRHAKANKGNRIAVGILIIIVSLFCFLSLVGALGGVGRMVYGFLAGFFGLAAYAYSLTGLIIGICITFNISFKIRPLKALMYYALLAVGIYALNIYTSSAHIVGAKYGEYLLNCYYNTNTAGGMLFGIASYPLMKLITPVGALVVACALFFMLSLVAIYPAIKRNVTYTASSTSERRKVKKIQRPQRAERTSTQKRESKRKARSVEALDEPTITDFSQNTADGEGLYVVDVEGDPMQRKGKRFRGADGYKPLGSFNPLYPNAQGGYEDEQKRPQYRPEYSGEEKFSPRGIARDILFGAGPSDDNLSKFGTVSDPRNALSSVSPSYNAVKRSDLRAKLGIDSTSQNAIREDFMSRYRAYQPVEDEQKPVQSQQSTAQPQQAEKVEEKKDDILDFKRDFLALKQAETQKFGERYMSQQEEKAQEKKEVVKPTRVMTDKEESIKTTIQKAEEAVNKPQVNVGMLGALNRAINGTEEPKPQKRQEEMTSLGYDLPTTAKVVAEQPKPQQAQPAQAKPVVKKQSATVEDAERSGYKPIQGEAKIPRAFAGTVVENKTADNQSVEEDSEVNYFGGIGKTKPVNKPKQYEMSDTTMPQKSKVVVENFDAQMPSEPAPKQQKVTGGDMSRTAIQSATAIAKQSAKDKESAEVDARIRNIKQAIKETPPIGQYEREALMREEKMKVAESRGIQKELPQKKENKSDNQKERLSQVNIEQAIEQATPARPYTAPPISLLRPPAPEVDQNEDYDLKKEQIVKTLAFFSITAEVIDILVGPTFTMYKLRVEMPRGRTINYISSLENDIAMKMEADSVRIIAPIPGENAVGIEVPNKFRRTVNLSEIIQSPEFNNSKSPSTFVVGKNLYGDNRVVEVRKLPHILIAGATGAGKSCCINSIIIGLLFKASPDDVRLILIDPKRMEMSVYAGIPHLLLDEIICDTDKAIRALNWAISEMERRTKFLAEVGYRDIESYNADCERTHYKKMPRIIIIVDEFADLMATGKKSVEDTVNRIARLARAVGIHLVLATQRPSVDVISGTIKNNIPSRIACKVTSSFDSKTVIDSIGAEKLLGMGDLLFMTPGTNDLERMQGAFITDAEIKSVVDFVKEKNDAYFDNNIKDAIFKDKEEEKPSQNSKDRNNDRNKITQDLCDALRLGVELREDQDAPISISFMQRRLGFGWPKASKLYDKMELMGYLSPDEKDPKKKKVNISYEDLQMLEESIDKDDEDN